MDSARDGQAYFQDHGQLREHMAMEDPSPAVDSQ